MLKTSEAFSGMAQVVLIVRVGILPSALSIVLIVYAIGTFAIAHRWSRLERQGRTRL